MTTPRDNLRRFLAWLNRVWPDTDWAEALIEGPFCPHCGNRLHDVESTTIGMLFGSRDPNRHSAICGYCGTESSWRNTPPRPSSTPGAIGP